MSYIYFTDTDLMIEVASEHMADNAMDQFVPVALLGQLLPYAKLLELANDASVKAAFATAQPYPHISFDNFFDPQVLDRVLSEFPSSDKLKTKFNNVREVKNTSNRDADIPPFSKAFIHAMNTAPFLEFLEAITGIGNLIADPYLFGGGLHELPKGGKLAIHTDFNFHRRMKLDRRVNILVYLNKDWKENYGGHFEAWSKGGKAAEASYLPLFNRLVIFNTNDYTYHGNPEPVNCPDGWSRKSIAMYYYTNGRPQDEWSGLNRTTHFMNRPGEAVVEKMPLQKRLLMMLPKPLRATISTAMRKRNADDTQDS